MITRKQITLSPEDVSLIVGALDTLGLALGNEHIWTEGERAIYETAISLLTGVNEDDDCMDSD
jgi:hypothetical protein